MSELDAGQDVLERLHGGASSLESGQDCLEYLNRQDATFVEGGQDCIEYLYAEISTSAQIRASQLAVEVFWISTLQATLSPVDDTPPNTTTSVECPTAQGAVPGFVRAQGAAFGFVKIQGSTAGFTRAQGVCE